MALNKNSERSERYGLERLNALTDGVVAIALTLLVLGIDIPEDHNFSTNGLKEFLIKLEPGLIAYLVSFVVIAVYWKIHHRIYNVVAYSNSIIVFLNLAFLFSISLIPFVAKIKSLYKFDELVVVIYAAAHIITGLILFATWKHFMANKELLKFSIDANKNRLISISILTIPLVSLLAIAFSFINIRVGTYLFFLIPILNSYQFYLSKPLYTSQLGEASQE